MPEDIRLTAQQLDYCRACIDQGRSFAILVVLGTEGSTYSKRGQAMFAGADGEMHGMLSGGCLEGDLVERAKRAIESGAADAVEYDLVDDDELFGLGVGCEGVMRILIQPLTPANDYASLPGIVDELRGAEFKELAFDDSATVRLHRPRRVLVLGGGLDADPLIDIAVSLGWSVAVADQKPVNLERHRERGNCEVIDSSDDGVTARIAAGAFDAAIVKNHNLVRDREHLQLLADTAVPFIGLLGPPHRRGRILAESAGLEDKLGNRLRGPVGTRIGGRGPAAVALEIAAELQAFFASR